MKVQKWICVLNIVIFVNPLLRNWLGNDWVEDGMGLVSPNILKFL